MGIFLLADGFAIGGYVIFGYVIFGYMLLPFVFCFVPLFINE